MQATIYKLIKKIVKKIVFKSFAIIYYFYPVKNNKIVVSNYAGKGYGDSGKYIVEEIRKRNLLVDVVWIVDKNESDKIELPNFIRKVNYGSLKHIYEMSTAKINIDNCRKYIDFNKKSEQVYINTMHSMLPLKKVERDAENNLSKSYIKWAKRDSKKIDYMVSSSKFKTKLIKKSYWYDGKVLNIGLPRNDVLYKDTNSIKITVAKNLNISEDKKILLYAPTFRNDTNLGTYNLDYNMLLDTLRKKYDTSWTILIRLHHNISSKNEELKTSDNIIDVTNYEDMQELLIYADILITDYSSCMFDFSLMKKPVFLFAPDIKEYTQERGFYMNLNELPYPIAQTNMQLKNMINDFKSYKYKNDLIIFNKKVGLYKGGYSSKKIVDLIEKTMGGN
ncbi:hypothetical protein AN639_06775 [Candidatus Epulonipiscium fishelsonii]|uniref:Uncharacterized protein n=1 Tax=Candidatus Epulonipiscium fishelsonii TaxID=77094 RepID=A0ACC8X7X3_9FIRM|nr:hypothetical protein AN396_12210 [Epulopiscium sp. SCG-B11WGA-EpuloA1]ONI39032.1 hypothetical protein AN639_06775 [Epulopiscium sp. SCG-B05WGA-EpuloA1]